jgi:hypothetical protein
MRQPLNSDIPSRKFTGGRRILGESPRFNEHILIRSNLKQVRIRATGTDVNFPRSDNFKLKDFSNASIKLLMPNLSTILEQEKRGLL